MMRITAIFIYLLSLIIIGSANSSSYAQNVDNSIPQYDLSIRLLPAEHRLEASGTLRLPTVNVSRSEIRLSLSELMRDFTVEVLEPATSVGIAGVERRDASGKNVKWIVRPLRPIPAGQSVLLRFSYAGGEQLANQFYIGSEVSFASAWGTDWYPLVDGGSDKGIGSLQFSVPTGQTVYATGIRRSSAQEAEQGVFKFESAHPTYFAFAAGNYTVVRRNGSVPAAVYLLRPRQNVNQYLDGVSRILNVLTQEFGTYPFDEFALVEIPRDLAQKAGFNAAAMQGFILLNSRAFDAPDIKYVLNFFGHEFSHQWFPHTTALKTPPGLYMEEALAEYGALRVVETLAGADAAEQYRRAGFEYDPGYSALQYFKLVGAGFDNKLSDLRSQLEHRNIAYSKGFLVFDMLSREVGRERFQRILHDLTRRYAFREIGWNEFLRIVEKGAGRNLRGFYEQWFERTDAPDFQLTWKQENEKLRGVINQTSPYYQTALEIEAKNNQGQRLVRTVKIRRGETSFSFPVNFRVESVTLDPHYLVLRWTPEYRNAASAARPSSQKSQ
ncbi:MAG: hypothetical protein M3410_16625 [Acidobacteriota bacterium]|nr:hypothetical protein [Acidobacteriota bacterium]